MLQQTRVDVVVPYYRRFLDRFPDVRALAAAPPDDVLQAWAGLGYYRRARNLHAAARLVVARHDGTVPQEAAELERLPGVGRYTSGAIRSIAFEDPAPILDGNVIRVFARLFGVQGDVTRAPVLRRMWDWAARWAAGPSPGDANQALMELGATCCTKPVPACDRCPLAGHCIAHRDGRELELPQPRLRPGAATLRLEAALAGRRGQILLVRRVAGSLLRDWWELPCCRRGSGPVGRTLVQQLRDRLELRLDQPRSVGTVRHAILEHRLDVTLVTGEVHRLNGRSDAPRRPHARALATRRPTASQATRTPIASLDLDRVESRWVGPEACRALPLSTLARKALRTAAACDPRWGAFLPPGFA